MVMAVTGTEDVVLQNGADRIDQNCFSYNKYIFCRFWTKTEHFKSTSRRLIFPPIHFSKCMTHQPMASMSNGGDFSVSYKARILV